MKFGTINGCKIYLKCTYGNPTNLKVKGIKYPLHLRKQTSDIQTFYQIFLDKEYDFKTKYEPKDIVDAGANIGLFAILMKNRFPNTNIICVEPDPENFKILESNTSRYSGIKCVNGGIWNKSTSLRVFDKFDSGKWGLVVEEDQVNGNIKAITIDDIMNNHNLSKIDLLKVDIETSEKILFSSNYENWLHKTTTLVVEPHDWIEDGCTQPVINAVSNCFDKYNLVISGETIVFSRHSLTL